MTAFFDTDVRALAGNPFKVETPFGCAVTVGIGNEFVRAYHLEAERDALREALEQARQFIASEYGDPKSQALDGEYVSAEARPVWYAICNALGGA